jgi:hypothetical protein
MANQKRITQLPIINALSGSANGASIIPVVVGGTTNQIIVERFSEFVNAYNATTSSNTFIGNQTISGSLVVTNDIRAERYYIETISSSVIYESGSTQFGDSIDDNHTFTGSLLVTGSVILNGTAIGIGQLNEQTASQDLVNLQISSTTGSINTTTASFDEVFLGISSVTGAMNTQSSSQDLVNLQISSTTGSINTTTSSFDSVFLQISSTTGSINTTTSSFDSVFLQISSTTGSINTTTASFDSVFLQISSTTGSINTTTSSFDSVFLGISSTTGSINTTTASFDSVFLGISSVTGAMNTQSSSQDLVNLQISSTTGSINTTTSSFDNVFFGISVVTSSIDAHILVQSTQTASQDLVNLEISIVTSSIDSHILDVSTQTGSQDLVNLGLSTATGSLIGITNELMAFTASTTTTNTSIDAHILAQSIQTASQDLVNFGISIVTSSIDSHILDVSTQTGSQDGVNFGISVVTSSIDTHILDVSTQTGSQDLVNLGISTFTGSLRDEVGGIEAYTASLKGAIEISGQDVNVLGMITAQQFNVTLVSSSVMYQSGSTEFGDTVDDIHTFTGTINLNGLALGTSELMAQTASQDSVNTGISAVTGAFSTELGSIDTHILGVSTQTGSQDGVNLEISIVTSSIDSHILGVSTQTGSQNSVNFGISVVTSSIDVHILDVSTQTGSQDGVNLGISTFTGSLRDEVDGIEAYTASLKGAAIVSSSQQIENYNLFAVTSSANTFYGNQTIGGDLLPETTEIHDLGSPSLRWRDLYLSGSTIDLGGLLIQRGVDGNVQFIDSASQATKSVSIDSITGSLDVSGNVTASNITATTLAGTLSTAAQTNVTSVGTLSSLAVSGDVSIADKIVHTGDTNTAIRFPSADTITFETSGAEAVRIDDSGNVGIGTSSPNLSSSDTAFTVNSASDSNAGIEISDGGTLAGVLYGKSTQQVGLWAVPNIYMTFATNNTERMRILAGGGLTFNGDTAAANALDDYEEGTFTPTITSGFTSVSYTNTNGLYTKIGRMVYFQIRLGITAGTDDSNSFKIGTLPFTFISTLGEQSALTIGYWDATNSEGKYGLISDNEIFFYGEASSSNVLGTTINDSSWTIHASGFYMTA